MREVESAQKMRSLKFSGSPNPHKKTRPCVN